MSIKNVILVGASGNLGRAVLPDLLKSEFNITILTRKGSSATFPSGTSVVQSEYSFEPLIQVLKGQDAVVSMMSISAAAEQETLAGAAIAAGVKLFIPSEFGSDTASDAVIAAVPFFKPKRTLIEFLTANEAKISWAGIVTSLFFDWSLKHGFGGFDIPNKTATLIDGGKSRFSATNVAQIARSIIAILRHPTLAANGFVYVKSFSVIQLEILSALRNATGENWKVQHKSSDILRAVGFQKLQEGDLANGGADIINTAMFGEAALGVHSQREAVTWNERLGLPKEDMDEVIREVLASLSS